MIARPRIVYGVLFAMVFVAGILSRTIDFDTKLLDKYLGDALYAVIFYLALGILAPRQRPMVRAIATAIFVVVIECFQLTGIPMELRHQGGMSKLISLVLGTVFSWWDMLAYFVGIVAITWFDKRWLRIPPGRAQRVSTGESL